jgi:predicted nucleotidyltransferase
LTGLQDRHDIDPGKLKNNICRLTIFSGHNVDKKIKDITQQIIDKYKSEKIILFGSAARGETDSDSDADFLIIKKDPSYYGADRIR